MPLFDNAGLATIPFTNQPGVVGSFPINIDPILTDFSDGAGNDLAGPPYNDTITYGSATITVTAVPEPSTVLLGGVALMLFAACWMGRHRVGSARA